MAPRLIRRDRNEKIKEVIELTESNLFTPERRAPKVVVDMVEFALNAGGSVTIVDTIGPVDRYIIKKIKTGIKGDYKESVRFYKDKTKSTWKAAKIHCNRLKRKAEQGEFINI